MADLYLDAAALEALRPCAAVHEDLRPQVDAAALAFSNALRAVAGWSQFLDCREYGASARPARAR